MMNKRKRTPLELEVDQELIAKGKKALKNFDESQEIYVPAQRGDTKPVSIRFPNEMIRQLREIAQRRGNMGYQQLVKIYVAEGISKTRRQPNFASQSHDPYISSVTSSLQLEFPHEMRFNWSENGQSYLVSSSTLEGIFSIQEGR